MCKSERASFSSAGPTAQVNSSPGVGFAQKATDDAAEVTTDDATAVATEEEATAVEVANSDEEKPGATKATVVATVSPLPKTTAYITVPAYCDAHTVNETHLDRLPSSIIPLYRDISNTLPLDCFSPWEQLVRVTAFVLRAIGNFKKLRRPQLPTVTKQDQPDTTPRRNVPSPFRSLSLPRAVPFLSANEMSASKIFKLGSSQHEWFANEMRSLSNGKCISTKNRLQRLKTSLDSTIPSRWMSFTKIALRLLSKTSYDTGWIAPHSSTFHHLYSQHHSHTRLKQSQHSSAQTLNFERRIHNKENHSPPLWLPTSRRLRCIPSNIRSPHVPFSCRATLSLPANWTRCLWTLCFKNTCENFSPA